MVDPQPFSLEWVLGATAVVVAVLAAHKAISLTIRTLLPEGFLRRLHVSLRAPVRAAATLAAVTGWAIARPLDDAEAVRRLLVVGGILTLGFLVVRLLRVASDETIRRLPLDRKDNLRQRRLQTQVVIARRVVSLVVIVLSLGLALWSFEPVRTIGAGIQASAGVLGLVVGIAGRSTVGNVIAGIQIALAEPIRLDDSVVVEGEWGWIEEITLTYVVVKIWDQRRLVLPTLYFVEQPFENWTKETSQITGEVVLHLDVTADIDDIRNELANILDSDDRWDRRASVVQVVDTTERTMVVRILVTAVDAPTAWDLRCAVRERLLSYLSTSRPDQLPRLRHAEMVPVAQEADHPSI